MVEVGAGREEGRLPFLQSPAEPCGNHRDPEGPSLRCGSPRHGGSHPAPPPPWPLWELCLVLVSFPAVVTVSHTAPTHLPPPILCGPTLRKAPQALRPRRGSPSAQCQRCYCSSAELTQLKLSENSPRCSHHTKSLSTWKIYALKIKRNPSSLVSVSKCSQERFVLQVNSSNGIVIKFLNYFHKSWVHKNTQDPFSKSHCLQVPWMREEVTRRALV